MDQGKPQAPGLKWRARGGGILNPYWVSRDGRTAVNLSVHGVWTGTAFEGKADELIARCQRLQIEAKMQHGAMSGPVFNGTFATLLDIYRQDPESTFHVNEPGTQALYDVYLPKLKIHIGELVVEHADGRDVKKWFRVWAGVEDLRDPAAHLPRAHAMLAVLKAAVSFGIVCRVQPCITFRAVLSELEFPSPPPRSSAPTADQVVAIRRAAHESGAPLRALCYALQFETGARTFDIIGQWYPLSYAQTSLVLRGNRKWVGPMWSSIDANLILHVKPSKTKDTTAVEGDFDLTVCPMVMEELGGIAGERSGPLIVHEATGLPYLYDTWRVSWRADFKAAGLPRTIWCRDLRAGGSTEASKAGSSLDDRAKLAMHSKRMQAKVYDRDTVEAHRRVMADRGKFRERGGE